MGNLDLDSYHVIITWQVIVGRYIYMEGHLIATTRDIYVQPLELRWLWAVCGLPFFCLKHTSGMNMGSVECGQFLAAHTLSSCPQHFKKTGKMPTINTFQNYVFQLKRLYIERPTGFNKGLLCLLHCLIYYVELDFWMQTIPSFHIGSIPNEW